MRTPFVAFLLMCGAAAFAAGCSDRSAGSALPARSFAAAPAARHRHRRAKARLYLHLPRRPHRRHSHYVSAGTESIGIVVTPASASPLPAIAVNVGPTAPACSPTPSGENCTIDAQAIPGVVNTFAIAAYASPDATGAVLSQGSISTPLPSSGPVPPLSLTLGGVVASLAMQLTNAFQPIGSTGGVTLTARDASGFAIIGPYDDPVTLSSSGSDVLLNGQSTLALTASPSTPVPLSYAGAPVYANVTSTPVTIAAASGSAHASATLHPGTAVLIFPLVSSSGGIGGGVLLAPNGQLYYGGIAGGDTAFGSFDLATGSVAAGPAFAGVIPSGFTADSANDLWFTNFKSVGVECLSSPTATTPVVYNAGVGIPTVMTRDSAGNLWWTDEGDPRLWYLSAPSGCGSGGTVTTSYTTANATRFVAPNGTQGVVAVDDTNLYRASAGGPNPAPSPLATPAFASTWYTGGVAVDANANVWVDFYGSSGDGWQQNGALQEEGGSHTTAMLPVGFNPTSLVADGNTLAFLASSVMYHPVFTIGNSGIGLYQTGSAPVVLPMAGAFGESVAGFMGCGQPAFDGSGGVWSICSDPAGTGLYLVHPLFGAGFAIFYDPATFFSGAFGYAAIGGAGATDQFTVSCTGQITQCAIDPNLPRMIDLTFGSGGSASLTITDTTIGQTQTISPTVLAESLPRHRRACRMLVTTTLTPGGFCDNLRLRPVRRLHERGAHPWSTIFSR